MEQDREERGEQDGGDTGEGGVMDHETMKHVLRAASGADSGCPYCVGGIIGRLCENLPLLPWHEVVKEMGGEETGRYWSWKEMEEKYVYWDD